MAKTHRHTRIVCTLGPATDTPQLLRQLLDAGMDVARLNAAHGSEEEQARRIARVRRIAKTTGRPLAILLDLPGPKLRLGSVPGGVRELRRGERVVLAGAAGEDPKTLAVRVPRFARQVRAGEPLFLADGNVHLRIERVRGARVECRVLSGGIVRSGSGLNLPESHLSIRLPTADDERWLRFANRHGIEWVGVSFVRTADDVAAVRRRVGRSGARVIAKIEKRHALENLEAIVANADGVMVARGDLGVETPLHEVPVVQKRIIAIANRRGRPVVTATQMLESMVDDPTPTRAEVTDVANAVLDGTDAVMLSAETAIGRYPIRAAAVLRDVILSVERTYDHEGAVERAGMSLSPDGAVAAEGVRLAASLAARALVAPARTLEDVTGLSRLRPEPPVLALTAGGRLFDQLALVWGVAPLRLSPDAPLTERVSAARLWLRRTLGVRNGRIVLLSSSELTRRQLDTLRVVDL